MPSVNFTQQRLSAIPPAKRGREVYHDAATPHLVLRVTPTGAKSFYVYRKVNGRPERIFLGHFPSTTVDQARRRAQEINGQIAIGENPQAVKREARGEITLSELYARYTEDHLKARGKELKNPASLWKLYLSAWGNRKLSAIGKAEVRAWHARIGRARGKVTANMALGLLRAMVNRALAWDLWDGQNPAAGIERFHESSRERFLHADELPRFFAALAEVPNATSRDYILLSLLTGARRSDVQAARWEDVNLERREWRFHVQKTKEWHAVPLTAEACAILESRRERAEASPWVFPGTGKTGHLVEPKRTWVSLLKKAGIRDLHLHDLRRTLGSWQAATGASLSIIGKTLAHRNVSTTAIYARLSLDPVRASVEAATKAMLEAGQAREPADIRPIKK